MSALGAEFTVRCRVHTSPWGDRAQASGSADRGLRGPQLRVGPSCAVRLRLAALCLQTRVFASSGTSPPEASRRGAARWGAAPRGPRPAGSAPTGRRGRWASEGLGLRDGRLPWETGASAVSRAWGGAEEGGEQGRRRAGAPHVHGRVPVTCIPPTSCFWSPVPAYTAPAPRSPGPRGRGLEAAPCLPAPGQWVLLSEYPPPPAAEASILVPRLWAPGPLPCGVSAASLRSRRPEPGQGVLPSGSGVLRGLGEPLGPPRTRHGAGRPGPLPFLRPRPVSQQDFSPDTERPVRVVIAGQSRAFPRSGLGPSLCAGGLPASGRGHSAPSPSLRRVSPVSSRLPRELSRFCWK